MLVLHKFFVLIQVAELLDRGEDPTVVDSRGRTPYEVAASKEVRDAFRRYAASEAGQQLDLAAAGIPSALTSEMEAHQAARQVCPPLHEGLSLPVYLLLGGHIHIN